MRREQLFRMENRQALDLLGRAPAMHLASTNEAGAPILRVLNFAVAGSGVMAVALERVDGKSKLAQNRKTEEVSRLLEQLWRRGDPGDARAVDLVRAANPAANPPFLACPSGARLLCAPTNSDQVVT